MQTEIKDERVSILTYNDYCTLAKEYLRSYNQFRSTLENLKNDKRDMYKRLREYEDVSAGVSKYGLAATVPTTGSSAGSVVERTSEKRERVRVRLKAIDRDIEELETIIRKIDRALTFMPTIEGEMVRLHFIERFKWYQVGESLGMSRHWVTEKGNEALKKMALMLFGSVAAMPEHNRFCFVK